MSSRIEKFYNAWMEECSINCISSREREESFLRKACDLLEESGDLPDGRMYCSHVVRKYSGEGNKYLDAFSLSEESYSETSSDLLDSPNILRLIFCIFSDIPKLTSLSKSSYDKSWHNMKKFYASVISGKCEIINDTHPISEVVRAIKKQLEVSNLTNTSPEVHLILITNQLVKYKLPSKEENNGTLFVYECWDMERLSGNNSSETVVDFTKFGGLPCLKVDLGEGVDIYESYLATIPGAALAESYNIYREKLLEQNVRVYLQNKGKVNQGMRDTLLHNPFVFFVFNNGLAITADGITLNEKENKINSLRNMQVVNGGQTMASIHNAWKSDPKKLQGVTVQAKLTIVNKALGDTLVSDISRYSNTQNAIKATDLDSNASVQRWYEELSRRIYTPHGSRWFYERVRGQYQNAQLDLTPSKKKLFQQNYPLNQKIDKTDLAKAVMSYELFPHLVTRGGEKTFSGVKELMGFGRLSELLWQQSGEHFFTDDFYRRCIAKMILFKATDEIAKQYCFRFTTYKAAIRGYIVSLLVYKLTLENTSLNLDYIWNQQCISESVESLMIKTASTLSQAIEESEQVHRLQEWLKTEQAWNSIKNYAKYIHFPEKQNKNHVAYLKKSPVYLTLLLKSNKDTKSWTINQKTVMLQYPTDFWEELLSWNECSKVLNKTQINAIKTRITRQRVPAEATCKNLLDSITKAQENGWITSSSKWKTATTIKFELQNNASNSYDLSNYQNLIVASSCDHKWMDSILTNIVQEYGSQLLATNTSPALGDVRTVSLPDGRKLFICYLRKRTTSFFFCPILVASLQNIRSILNSEECTVMPLLGADFSDGQESTIRQIRQAIVDNLSGFKITVI